MQSWNWQDEGSTFLTPIDCNRVLDGFACTARAAEHAEQCDTCGQQPMFCDCNRFDRDDQFADTWLLIGEQQSNITTYI